jgi:hypothetical protein
MLYSNTSTDPLPPADIPADVPIPTMPQRVNGLTQVQFDLAQLADQARVPWLWSTTKTDEPYQPQADGKWLYLWAQTYQGSQAVVSSVGRIMETDLGIQFSEDDRCTRCIEDGHECWAYTDKARGQIKNPGSACARCRANPHPTKGCSLARRRPKQPKFPRDPPPNRFILPKGGGEGPGAGGIGMVV